MVSRSICRRFALSGIIASLAGDKRLGATGNNQALVAFTFTINDEKNAVTSPQEISI